MKEEKVREEYAPDKNKTRTVKCLGVSKYNFTVRQFSSD